jgi:hypothetical protein
MGIAPPNVEGTYGKRLRQYQRRGSMILWVGAGLTGLVVLVTSDLGDNAPDWLNATDATLIILGGAALATARIKFEWAATELERAIADGKRRDTRLSGGFKVWPRVAEVAWLTGLVSVPLAALTYLAAIWWSAS